MAEFTAAVADLSDAAFKRAAGRALLDIRRHLRKVDNACDEGDEARAAQAAEWGGYIIAAFVALLNRRCYARADLRWLKESVAFRSLPREYEMPMRQVHAARSGRDVLKAYSKLWKECEGLAKERGISMEAYASLDDLEF